MVVKEELKAKRIQGREVTGFGGVQEPRADIRTNKDGFELLQFKTCSENNSIHCRKIMFEDQFTGIGNMSSLDIHNPYSSDRYIDRKFIQDSSEVYFSNFFTVFDAIEGRDNFSQRDTGNQDLIFGGFKDLDYSGATNLQMVALNQGASIEEIQHPLSLLFSHPGNFLSQTSLDFTQAPVDFLQGRCLLMNPFFGNILITRNDWQTSADKILDSNSFSSYRHSFLLSLFKYNTILDYLSSYFIPEAEAVETTFSTLHQPIPPRRWDKGYPDIFRDKIISIEYVGNQHVFDIEVDGTHNFVAEGIVAHNTFIDQKTENRRQTTEGNQGISETGDQVQVEGKDINPGGIDLTNIPIIQQPLNQGNNVGRPTSNILPDSEELETTRNLVELAVEYKHIPEIERLKQWITLSLREDKFYQELNKILSCLVGIFRLQEEDFLPTPESLTKLLSLLEQDKPPEELISSLEAI